MKFSIIMEVIFLMQKSVNSRKRGLAFSMAAMIGATAIPAAGSAPVWKVYAAEETQTDQTTDTKESADVSSDIAVDSTVVPKSADTQQVQISDGKLLTAKKDGSAQETALASKISLVDAKADESAKQLYAYLKAVGNSDSVIFGHQNDTFNKAGNADLSASDTKDVTGSIAGILGVDMQDVAEKGLDTMVEITNAALAEGALITMSGHMPNFANVPENPDYKNGDPTWKKYDYNGYTAPVTTNDPVNQILPGGKYNKVYTAYLDLIAEYAKQVKGAILFRPFHEGTGSWFWWGAAFCDPQISKNVYRYTVEYMRDTKKVHNLIYEYGPGSSAETLDDYAQRYPGDAYVDLVGFDMYDNQPADDGVFMGQLKKQLQLVVPCKVQNCIKNMI